MLLSVIPPILSHALIDSSVLFRSLQLMKVILYPMEVNTALKILLDISLRTIPNNLLYRI